MKEEIDQINRINQTYQRLGFAIGLIVGMGVGVIMTILTIMSV
jgi:hypothetical protein